MRIRTLELTRFGKFTDAVLDFGDAIAGAPDLHVIYGPNEAGKSTTFAAILDLLFGIHTQSPYSFLHGYPSMRIGATLEMVGERRRFVRIKKPQNSLLDGNDRPLPEAAILAELGGMDRDAYEKMFFLDDGTLEKGGEDILASEGELGKLLFSASAGLANLGGRLAGMKAEAEAFYKFKARSGRLGDMKTKLTDLKSQREALDFLASEHKAMVEQRDRLVAAYAQANADRTQTQNRIDEIARTMLAMPRLAELRQVEIELSELGGIKPAVKGWKEEVPRLEKKAVEHAAESRRLRENRERLEAELLKSPADPVALRLSARVERLGSLKARFITADGDIPKLRARLAETSIDGILMRLGRRGEADPAALVIDAVTRGGFMELIEARSGIEAKLKSAEDELRKAERALDQAGATASVDASTESMAVRSHRFESLAVSIASHRSGSTEQRVVSAKRAQTQAVEVLDDAVRRLTPWAGHPDELVADPVSDRGELSRWTTEFEEHRKAVEQVGVEIPRLESELRRLEGEVAALTSSVGTAATADAADARALRDAAWMQHRTALSDETAELFEARMRFDDAVQAERSLRAADVERLKQLALRSATLQADLETATRMRDLSAGRREAILDEISERLSSWKSGFAWRPEPSGLASWLAVRDRALEARSKAKETDAAVEAALNDLRIATVVVRSQLLDLGIEPPIEDVLSRFVEVGQEALEAHKQSVSLQNELIRLQGGVKERQTHYDSSIEENADWNNRWERLCQGCWIGSLAATPGTQAMKEILSASKELADSLEARASLIDRLEKMEKDQDDFRSEVRALCEVTGVSPDFTELELARILEDKVRDAARNLERKEKVELELEKTEAAETELAQDKQAVADQRNRMTAYYDVDTLSEVEQCIATAEKQVALEQKVTDLRQQLVEATRVTSIDVAMTMLDGADRGELLAQETSLKGLLVDQDARCHELFHQRSTAIDKLESQGGDGKVAELEEQRRTLLLDMEEQARQYLVLRAASIAADQALSLYRDRHRSSMMGKASEAFEMISRGAYKGLAVQPAKAGETLIALSRTGGSKAADQLSKGARFQLYLALRVAGYHEFVKSRSSVPFIADDIMETFDDFRAEEAFRLFAGMAEHGQVIYMTHHRHLTSIAKEVCPGVRIHDLDTIVANAEGSVAAE